MADLITESINRFESYRRVEQALRKQRRRDIVPTINGQNYHGETPLGCAVRRANLPIIELLLQSGAGTEQGSGERYLNQTPLHIAASLPNPVAARQIINLLLSKGASLDQADQLGRTPLDLAMERGHGQTVRLLLRHGVRIPEGRDCRVTTHQHYTEGRLQSFLHGSRAEIIPAYQQCLAPLHCGAQRGCIKKVLEQLLNRAGGADDIDATNRHGRTPLHCAADQGRTQIVQLLLDRGADVDVRDQEQRTPLHCAVDRGCRPTAKRLLSRGANLEATNQQGQTPLLGAILKRDMGMVKLLLNHGADIRHAEDDRDYTPLHYAAWRTGDLGMVKLLLRHGADPNPPPIRFNWTESSTLLVGATVHSDLRLVKLLLHHGANPNQRGSAHGYTPLIWATMKDDKKMVKLLLRHGRADPNLAREGGSGWTPLFYAVTSCNLKMTRLLLRHGANVSHMEAEQRGSQTPLHLACLTSILLRRRGYNGNDISSSTAEINTTRVILQIIKLLLVHAGGSSVVNLSSNAGDTPLSCAAAYGIPKVKVVQTLLHHGADIAAAFRGSRTINKLLDWLEGAQNGIDPEEQQEDPPTRTILSLKEYFQEQASRGPLFLLIRRVFLPEPEPDPHLQWDGVVLLLWFHYFGNNTKKKNGKIFFNQRPKNGQPPLIAVTARLSDVAFLSTYKWMIPAAASLAHAVDDRLLQHLCHVYSADLALEVSSELGGKIPLWIALDAFSKEDWNDEEKALACRAMETLVDWNPSALRVRHPQSRRLVLHSAVEKSVSISLIHKMVQFWPAAAAEQRDPVTGLYPFLLLASSKKEGDDCDGLQDIYPLLRTVLPQYCTVAVNTRNKLQQKIVRLETTRTF